jgi:hypothetical protein
MPTAGDELFQYAIGFVTPADIAAFAPNDPGYPNYVREFCDILITRMPPEKAHFDITETVGLTRWVDANCESDPLRFRRFRIFTNAVALAMAVLDRADDEQFPPNYTMISLIDDALSIKDDVLWRMLRPAFEQAHEAFRRHKSEETVFATLGLLLVDAKLGVGQAEMNTLADLLIEEENQCRNLKNGAFIADAAFVLGCTFYNSLHSLWIRYVDELLKPATPSLALVREAILTERLQPPLPWQKH